jgi:cellulose synthase (UDP-forming)
LLVAAAALGALLYVSFLFNPRNAGDLLAYALVLAAESFFVFQALIALWTILAGGNNPRDFEYYVARRNLLNGPIRSRIRHSHASTLPLFLNQQPVSVDILIPVYGEPLYKVEATMLAARNVVGLHGTYVLDDGKSDELRDLAVRHGVGYIRRPHNTGAKAGNINYALANTSADFFVILDADFVVKPKFLIETLPFFAQRQVAFVQTPQHYGNLHNLISRGAGYMQTVFYRLIQPGKNRFDAAFCVGTNVVFRRTAIDEIGGLYEKSKSEDIWTSILLHERGYRSVFISDVLATGDAPDTIAAYMKQQLRWATGGFEILLRYNPLRAKLSFDQKLQYLSTASYYLHGVAMFLLMLLPPLHIVFNISPVDLSITFAAWLFYYLAFYAMQMVVPFYTMGGFRLEAIMMAMVSFPVYLKALAGVVRGRELTWHATGNRASQPGPFDFILPQLLIFGFLSIISAAGIWKTFYTGELSLSLVWNLINTAVFGAFVAIAVRESRRLPRRRRRRQPATRMVTARKVEA